MLYREERARVRRRPTGVRSSARGRALPRVSGAARVAAAHRHTDAGPDRIVCLLCGETYRAITYLHLKRVHGFEGAHPIRDYKERFGLRVAACEEVCLTHKGTQIARHQRAGRHWTKARILGEIRKGRRRKNRLAYSRVPVALSLAARRAYGSWDEALRRAGVNPSAVRMKRSWSRDKVTADIRALASDGGRASALRAQQLAPALHRAAYRAYGSWSAAVRAAGLEVGAHREPKRWTLARVIEWVRKTHEGGGDLRSTAAPSGAQARVARELRQTWSRFIEAQGIPYAGTIPRLDWTDAGVLAGIRARRRRGLALNVAAIQRDDLGLYQQGVRRFGTWDAALRAGGLDPESIRRARPWTREQILSGIRARSRAGRSMAYRASLADEPRLVRAALTAFPTSWTRALAAAGVGTESRRTVRGRRRGRGRAKR